MEAGDASSTSSSNSESSSESSSDSSSSSERDGDGEDTTSDEASQGDGAGNNNASGGDEADQRNASDDDSKKHLDDKTKEGGSGKSTDDSEKSLEGGTSGTTDRIEGKNKSANGDNNGSEGDDVAPNRVDNNVAESSANKSPKDPINVTALKKKFNDIIDRSKGHDVIAEFKVAQKHDQTTITTNVPFKFQKRLDIRKHGKYFLTINVETETRQMLQQAWGSNPDVTRSLPGWAGEFIHLLRSLKSMWDNSLEHNNDSHDQKHIVLWRTDEMGRFFRPPET